MNTKLFGIFKAVYSTILRPLVAEKIKESTTEIDDFVLEVLDKIFGYDGQ